MFYEDPILPDSLDAMELIARKIKIPIATGGGFARSRSSPRSCSVGRCSISGRTCAWRAG